MKAILFSLLSLLFANAAQAIDHYKTGDTLHVWAKSGLRMRLSPDVKSDILATLPYGEKVVVVEDSLPRMAFSTIEAKVFKITGFWVKVQAGELVGFVFDGYLGRLPVLKKTEKGYEKVEVWAAREFSFSKKLRVKKWIEKAENWKCEETTFSTTNGIVYWDSSTEKGSSGEIQMTDVSMAEAYFFCSVCLNLYDARGFQISESTKNHLSLNDTELCSIELDREGKKVIIRWDCSC